MNRTFLPIIATIVLLPLYFVKLRFLGASLLLLDVVLVGVFLVRWADPDARMAHLFSPMKDNILFLGSVLLLSAVLVLHALFGGNAAAGIVKSWFVLPFVFFLIVRERLRDAPAASGARLLVWYGGMGALVAAAGLLFGTFTFDGRLVFLFGNPNYFAMFLAPVFLVLVYLLIKDFSAPGRDARKMAALSCALCLVAAAEVLTFSYSVWLGIAAGTLYLAGMLPRGRQKIYLPVFIGICLVVLVAGNSEKFFNLFHERSSFAARTEVWRTAWEMIKEHPLRGVGLGNFQDAYISLQEKFPPYLHWAVLHAHNTFLHVFAETGLFGLAGFVGIVASLILASLRKIKEDPFGEGLLVGSFLIYFFVNGATDTLYFKNDLSLVFWFFAALL